MSNPIIIETEILSVEDLWDAISGKRLVNTGLAAKKYSIRPLLLVEWELTEGSADTWVVGFPGREDA
jgi:hypothetical protein